MFFSGVMSTAISSLTLEQVPRFRGIMMSINSTISNIGLAIGASIGGIIIFFIRYKFLGFGLGIMDVIITLSNIFLSE